MKNEPVMRIVDRKTRASENAGDGIRRYRDLGDGQMFDGRSYAEFADQLAALGPEPDPDALDRVVGNPWSLTFCDGCGEQVATTVEIPARVFETDAPEYCASCIQRAHGLMHERLHGDDC